MFWTAHMLMKCQHDCCGLEMKNKMYNIFHNVNHFSNFSDFVNLMPCPFLTFLEILLLQIRSKHILDFGNKGTHGPILSPLNTISTTTYLQQ